MKRIFTANARVMAFVLALSMLFSSAAFAQSDPTAWYGDGSATEYFIGAAEELAYLAYLNNNRKDTFNGKTITITADIDLAGIDTELYKYPMTVSATGVETPYDGNGWVPIGLYVSAWRFGGTFDGNGFVVKNLYINRPNVGRNDGQGLFGYTFSNNVIKNLGLIDVDVTGNYYVGGIAGSAGALIENCFVTGKVTGFDDGIYTAGHYSGEFIGGIAGAGSNIRNSYSTAEITARGMAGGVGGIFNSTQPSTKISEYLYSTGTVTTTYPQNIGSGGTSGGLFGWLEYENKALQNSVALNPWLASGNTDMFYHKRIAYESTPYADTIDFINNYAWEGMVFKNLAGEVAGTFKDDGRDTEDGESVSTNLVNSGKVWGADYANFPTDIWIIEPGKLPILRIFEERNAERGGVSLQSGALPDHIEPYEATGLGVLYNDGAVVVKNAERLAVATLWFTAASGTPSYEGLNNFAVLDTAFSGGLHRVTLGYLVAGGEGFTSANAGLVKITGVIGVNLVNARFSGYDANGNAGDISYQVVKDTTGGVIIPGDPGVTTNYDLNGDGVIDQLDLAIALKYFMVNGGDANWNAAKIADFNKDGRVDIEDFILLLNHMQW